MFFEVRTISGQLNNNQTSNSMRHVVARTIRKSILQTTARGVYYSKIDFANYCSGGKCNVGEIMTRVGENVTGEIMTS